MTKLELAQLFYDEVMAEAEIENIAENPLCWYMLGAIIKGTNVALFTKENNDTASLVRALPHGQLWNLWIDNRPTQDEINIMLVTLRLTS